MTLAAQNDARPVVMGATGTRGRDICGGSTTEKVVRKSGVPVLAIPVGAQRTYIDRILVPTDYSKLSFRALRGAVALADPWSPKLPCALLLNLHGSPPRR